MCHDAQLRVLAHNFHATIKGIGFQMKKIGFREPFFLIMTKKFVWATALLYPVVSTYTPLVMSQIMRDSFSNKKLFLYVLLKF